MYNYMENQTHVRKTFVLEKTLSIRSIIEFPVISYLHHEVEVEVGHLKSMTGSARPLGT